MFDKISLKGIPNYKTDNKFELAAKQEKFTCDIFNKVYDNRIWMTTTEFIGYNDTEMNRILGDFVCLDKNTNKLLACFDLKVQEYGSNKPWLSGAITLNSYFGFGHDHHNHYYVMCNEYGENIIIFDACEITKMFHQNQKFIHETKFKRRVYQYELYNWAHKFYLNEEVEGVAENDFISSQYLKRFNLRKTL